MSLQGKSDIVNNKTKPQTTPTTDQNAEKRPSCVGSSFAKSKIDGIYLERKP
jgi:hypothetical protein